MQHSKLNHKNAQSEQKNISCKYRRKMEKNWRKIIERLLSKNTTEIISNTSEAEKSQGDINVRRCKLHTLTC